MRIGNPPNRLALPPLLFSRGGGGEGLQEGGGSLCVKRSWMQVRTGEKADGRTDGRTDGGDRSYSFSPSKSGFFSRDVVGKLLGNSYWGLIDIKSYPLSSNQGVMFWCQSYV